MNKVKKVLLVADNLKSGGVTSFTINLAKFLLENNCTVDIMLGNDFGAKGKLPESINILSAYKPSKLILIGRCIQRFKISSLFSLIFRNHYNNKGVRHIQVVSRISAEYSKSSNNRYDFAVACQEFWSTYYVSEKVTAKTKIAWEHSNYIEAGMNAAHDLRYYNSFNWICTISNSCFNAFIRSFPMMVDKILIIENILDQQDIIKKSMEFIPEMSFDKNKLRVVTVARLDLSSKRQDRAIKVAEKLKDVCDFTWYFVGDGKDMKKIGSLIKERNLEEYCLLLGNKENPYPYIRYSDVFVLTSQFEGKPISISESLMLGCPVITTDFDGAADQIKSFGLTVENNDEVLVEQIVEILRNKDQISRIRTELGHFYYDNSKAYGKLRNVFEIYRESTNE